MTRVIGSSMARIASAQIDAIESRIDEPTFADGTEPGVLRARFLVPAMPRILEYTWKRHLQVAARRRMVREATAAEGNHAQAVGFADLVGFTALSQQLDDHELAMIVDRFEATAYDIVGALGGRVIKMIGDEVMFAVDDVANGPRDRAVARRGVPRRRVALRRACRPRPRAGARTRGRSVRGPRSTSRAASSRSRTPRRSSSPPTSTTRWTSATGCGGSRCALVS